MSLKNRFLNWWRRYKCRHGNHETIVTVGPAEIHHHHLNGKEIFVTEQPIVQTLCIHCGKRTGWTTLD